MKKLKKLPLKHKGKAKPKEKKQSGELLDDTQELFYYGAPPILKGLYRVNNGYKADFHPQDMLIQFNNGVSPAELSASWGISVSTLRAWVEKYPEMAEAWSIGSTAYEGYWKRNARLAAFGHVRVKEAILFKILDNQVGFNDTVGGHEFADTLGAELVILDGDGKEL